MKKNQMHRRQKMKLKKKSKKRNSPPTRQKTFNWKYPEPKYAGRIAVYDKSIQAREVKQNDIFVNPQFLNDKIYGHYVATDNKNIVNVEKPQKGIDRFFKLDEVEPPEMQKDTIEIQNEIKAEFSIGGVPQKLPLEIMRCRENSLLLSEKYGLEPTYCGQGWDIRTVLEHYCGDLDASRNLSDLWKLYNDEECQTIWFNSTKTMCEKGNLVVSFPRQAFSLEELNWHVRECLEYGKDYHGGIAEYYENHFN